METSESYTPGPFLWGGSAVGRREKMINLLNIYQHTADIVQESLFPT